MDASDAVVGMKVVLNDNEAYEYVFAEGQVLEIIGGINVEGFRVSDGETTKWMYDWRFEPAPEPEPELFQVGMEVICIDGFDNIEPISGYTYVVESISTNGDFLRVSRNGKHLGGYLKHRFAPIEDDLEEGIPSEGVNPKDAVASAKPGFNYLPIGPLMETNGAFTDGAVKYGPFNWRETKVRSDVYYNAALRHITAWWMGEDYADDSGVHHLAHAMACLMILRDADQQGTLDDNRHANSLVPAGDIINDFVVGAL